LGLGTLATQSGTFSGGGTFASGGFTLTLSGNGGTLALGGFTLTVPATGTAALLGAANVFTAVNTFNESPTAPQNTQSERFGSTASNAGNRQVAIGFAANNTGTGTSYGIAIGHSSRTASSYGIAIGALTDVNAGHTSSVAFGYSSQTTASNQWVTGSGANFFISDVYIGKGVIDAAPTSTTYNATGGSGTNIAGADIGIAAGKGTGSALSGRVVFYTSPAGASGATLQTIKERWSIPQAGSLNAWQESSVQTRQVLGIVPTLVVATDASRTGRAVFNVYDTAVREAMRIEASGTAPMIGFLGANAAVRQAHIADASGDDATAVNAILDVLEAFGLVATS
jgi:hypothetical protein